MSLVICSLCAQGVNAVSGFNSGNYIRGAATLLLGGTMAVSAVGVGVIGGGYYGMTGAGKLTEKYYDRYGDANKMRTLNIGISMLAGGIVGAATGGVIGSYVATAIAVNALETI